MFDILGLTALQRLLNNIHIWSEVAVHDGSILKAIFPSFIIYLFYFLG